MPSKEHLIDLDLKLQNVHPLAYDLIKWCLAIDPDEWQDCASLLKHAYFEGCQEEFEIEISSMIMSDTSEFYMESTLRDGDNFFNNDGDVTPIFNYQKDSKWVDEDLVSFHNSESCEEAEVKFKYSIPIKEKEVPLDSVVIKK
jgi:serine/threonine protein kinase